MFKRKAQIDYESLYHDSQQKLSFFMEALEQKQIQCDKIESIVESLKQENKTLKDKLSQIEQSMLDLPKLLGKNLGK